MSDHAEASETMQLANGAVKRALEFESDVNRFRHQTL